ncbi:MAG: NAD(P)-dependent oxidoreductase [Planctomycetota bacterium]
MKPIVLVTERLDDGCAAWLAERADLRWVAHNDRDAMAATLPLAEGLVVRTYTQVDASLLAQAPKLRVVGRAGVGLDNFDLPACHAAGVAVVYTPDANTQAVVEYVFGLMLDHFRPRTDIPVGADAAAFHALRQTEVGRQLDELTLGVLGCGRIGTRVAAIAHAVGMNLRVCDLKPEPELRKTLAAPFDYVDHTTLYAESDIVTVHVDNRPKNRGLIDATALARMRPDALLINAARGMLVDHAALLRWLDERPEASAILDVHDPEPPPGDSPLHGRSDVRLLPHLASRTGTALKNMSWVVRDVAAVLAGEGPRFPAE